MANIFEVKFDMLCNAVRMKKTDALNANKDYINFLFSLAQIEFDEYVELHHFARWLAGCSDG